MKMNFSNHLIFTCLLITALLLSNPVSVTGQSDGSRDPFKQPFSSSSIWNMPIGQGARYIKADLETVSEGMTVDEDLIFLTPDAPVMDVFINNAEWSGRDRCPIEGGLLYSVPCPDDFVYSPDTWDGVIPNAGIASLLQDRRTIVQSQPFARCTAGQAGTSKYRYPDQDLYGQGIGGAHGGSGLSAIGGAIRAGELLPGAGPIKHVLKINIYAAENIRYEDVNKMTF